MIINGLDKWYFSPETIGANKVKYISFMIIALFAMLVSFSPIIVGNGIGAALYIATLAIDFYMQLTLPIRCKLPMSFIVGGLTLMAVALGVSLL